MSEKVFLSYLNDYNIADLKKAVDNCFKSFNIQSKIKPNMKILIKVCLPEAISQDAAKTTHPAVVQALVDALIKMGAKCIVADSPSSRHNIDYLNEVYFLAGMLDMANSTHCELNQNLKTSEIEVLGGIKTKSITTLDVINQVDAIINVGKLKFDENLGYLGATSNLFGLIPAEMKNLILNRFINLGDFNDYLIDMHEALKEKIILNVLDAVVTQEANNTPRLLNCLGMSESPYSLDAAMFDIFDIDYSNTLLNQAQKRFLFDFNKAYKNIGEDISKFKLEDYAIIEFDNLKEIKQPMGYFKTHQQRVAIEKNKCKGCTICSKICPTNAIMMKYDKNGELFAEIDYKRCIFCKKCVTACPYNVVELRTQLAYKTMMKELEKYNKD